MILVSKVPNCNQKRYAQLGIIPALNKDLHTCLYNCHEETSQSGLRDD